MFALGRMLKLKSDWGPRSDVKSGETLLPALPGRAGESSLKRTCNSTRSCVNWSILALSEASFAFTTVLPVPVEPPEVPCIGGADQVASGAGTAGEACGRIKGREVGTKPAGNGVRPPGAGVAFLSTP